MKCKIDGCERDAVYVKKQLCQMHYFRFMRNGHYELISDTGEKRKISPRNRIHRRTNTNGYQLINSPGHPLAQKNGYVYEHRLVIYNKYGDNLPNCEFCGKPCSWEPYKTHIDHIDEDVSNNNESNLRVLCNSCNVGRSKGKTPEREKKGRVLLTHEGETKTASEWSRDSRISVLRHVILQRKRRGLSDYDCLFMAKKTHNKK